MDTKAIASGMKSQATWKRIVNAVTSTFHKGENSLRLEAMNPMWNITSHEAQMIFDLARSGNYSKLQFIYNEIERTDPTLLVCVTRRASALSELDWKVVRSDERRNRNVDEGLVKEQIECLETEMARIENLPDAIEHLALSAFRGYSHVSPVHRPDGSLRKLDILDNWNFCWDMEQKGWLWNPTASAFMSPRAGKNGLELIPKGELVSVIDPRPIDWPGLKIFLRNSISERDWGRFLETYGLPPVIITMPDFTSEEDAKRFEQAAHSVFEGRSGVVPYGSEVNYASESRGVDPFSAFIEHQQKLIVLMATGGILTSLAEAGSGTLGGNAHQETWMQIVRRDVRKQSNAIDKMLCARILEEKFPGKPKLAEFRLETERDPSPKEVFEIAGAAASAGYRIDPKEIQEQSGYTVSLIDQGGGMGGMGPDMGGGDDPDGGGAPSEGEEGGEDASEGVGGDNDTPDAQSAQTGVSNTVVKNANEVRKPMTAAQKLAWSLQLDFKDVADRINAILQMPEAEQPAAAEKLIEELDGLVSEDPAMASVIAEEMTKAFGKVSGANTEMVEPKE